MLENTFEVRVGKLVEIRIAKGYGTLEEVEQMRQLVRRTLSTLPADFRHVTIADWRQCKLMPPRVAEQMLNMWMSANPTTVRSALLYSEESPTAVMQFLRLIRDSDHPNRRMFSDPNELAAWLDEVLTAAESARLRQFLGDATNGGAG